MWKETVETDGLVFFVKTFPNNIFYGEKSEAKYPVAEVNTSVVD